LDGVECVEVSSYMDNSPCYLPPEGRHGLAARCLHGQPFGFTREDVVRCRRAAHAAEGRHDQSGEWADYEDMEAWASLADRIEALLPPEDA
jgi:hypothetical protein